VAAVVGAIAALSLKSDPIVREVAKAALALVFATIIFHSLVPVDLDPRYMSSAIPPLVILAVLGVWCAARMLGISSRHWLVLPIAAALLCIPGALFL
jgi:hypothetical protein